MNIRGTYDRLLLLAQLTTIAVRERVGLHVIVKTFEKPPSYEIRTGNRLSYFARPRNRSSPESKGRVHRHNKKKGQECFSHFMTVFSPSRSSRGLLKSHCRLDRRQTKKSNFSTKFRLTFD